MKMLITAVLLALAIAAPLATKAAVDPVALVYLMGVAVGSQTGKEVPYHLTDACKAQTIPVTGTNYSYSSYEHCLKK